MAGGTLLADSAACAETEECADATSTLISQARHSTLAALYYGLFMKLYVLGLFAYLALAAILLASPFGPALARHRGASLAAQWVSLTLAAIPLAALTANRFGWWNSPHPWPSLTMGIAAIACAAALFSVGAAGRSVPGPMLVLTGATSLAYLADAAFGSHALADSFFGFLLVIRGRFYGVNNEAFGPILVGALLVLAYLAVGLRGPDGPEGSAARPWRAILVTGLLGSALLAIEGAPGLGTDFGGVLALAPALALLLLLVGRIRVSPAKAAAIAGGTALVIVAVSVADWLRPAASRTHLGGFVQQILDGTAWQYAIVPKLRANLYLLTHDRWGRFAFAAAAFLVVVLGPALAGRAGGRQRRGAWAWMASKAGKPVAGLLRRDEALGSGLAAVGLACLLGALLNDSGIIIPGIALAVAVPMLVATALRACTTAAPDVPATKPTESKLPAASA